MADIELIRAREHVLHRLGYGPTPAERTLYDSIGHSAWVDQQITGAGLAAPLDWPMSVADLQGNGTKEEALLKTVRMFLDRAISAPNQLQTVLQDHWFNHFNVFALMGNSKHQLDDYLNVAIYPHVLGNFGDMLEATARHPAMLHYLDNRKNAAASQTLTVERPKYSNVVYPTAAQHFAAGETTIVHPVVGRNENYAREVMELHTLGVHDPYTQSDIESATRILSGWSSNFYNRHLDEYEWRDDLHDTSVKTFRGSTFGDEFTGEAEVVNWLRYLSDQKSTARRVISKLLVRFIGAASPADIETLLWAWDGQALTAADRPPMPRGDLTSLMRGLIALPSFAAASTRRSRFKAPHRYVISAFRTLGATPTAGTLYGLAQQLELMGDTPFFYGPPTGYPDDDGYWLSPDGMLNRVILAKQLAETPEIVAAINALLVGTRSMKERLLTIANEILPGGASAQTILQTQRYGEVAPTLAEEATRFTEAMFASPEFMRY